MIEKMDFIKMQDANVLFLKVMQKHGSRIDDDLEYEMFRAINGETVVGILRTIARNMEENRPGINYIYKMRVSEDTVEEHVSSEVVEKVFPELLGVSYEEMKPTVDEFILKHKIL